MAYFEFPHTRSYEGDLGYIIKNMSKLIDDYNSIVDDQKAIDEKMAEIEATYQATLDGDFPESLKEAFYNWMIENASNIVARMIKNVFFGLTDSGYFTAYIPDSWQDITFKTTGFDVIVPTVPEYGHLVLQY